MTYFKKTKWLSPLLILALIFFFNSFISATEKSYFASTDSNIVQLFRMDDMACSSICVKNEIVFVANGQKLTLLDCRNELNPFKISDIKCDGIISNIFITDTLAFASLRDGGLTIINIQNENLLYTINTILDNITIESLHVKDSLIYASCGNEGLYIVDIKDINSPQILSHIMSSSFTFSSVVKDSMLIIAEGLEGISIYNIRDKNNPLQISKTSTGGECSALTILDSIVYITHSMGGLWAWNINNYWNPYELDYIQNFGNSVALSVDSAYAYIANSHEGCVVYDISKPDSLVKIAYYKTFGNVEDIIHLDDRIYLADSDSGLYCLTISIGSGADNHYNSSIAISDTAVFFMDTLLYPVYYNVGIENAVSSFEIEFSGFYDSFDTLILFVDSSLSIYENWDIEMNITDTMLYIAGAGIQNISGNGVLFYFKLLNKQNWIGEIPICINQATLNDITCSIPLEYSIIEILDIKYGDVSLDTYVGAFDASLILKYVAGLLDLNSYQKYYGDVSGDGSLSALDASIVLQYAVKKIATLPADSSELNFIASGNITINNQITEKELNTIEMPIYLTDRDNVLAFDGTIEFDTTFFILNDIRRGEEENYLIQYQEEAGIISFCGACSEYKENENPVLYLVLTKKTNDISESYISLKQFRTNEGEYLLYSDSASFYYPTGLNDIEIPKEFVLKQNYPNPFNSGTEINYYLPVLSDLTLIIYNLSGQMVIKKSYSQQKVGWHKEFWNGKNENMENVSSGLYLYKIKYNYKSLSKKMLLLK
ncbi:T9SS type A sorting domain-containing protein [bacterium]|nr:T9SS type A sorting domain-containing protein [bacterium]